MPMVRPTRPVAGFSAFFGLNDLFVDSAPTTAQARRSSPPTSPQRPRRSISALLPARSALRSPSLPVTISPRSQRRSTRPRPRGRPRARRRRHPTAPIGNRWRSVHRDRGSRRRRYPARGSRPCHGNAPVLRVALRVRFRYRRRAEKLSPRRGPMGSGREPPGAITPESPTRRPSTRLPPRSPTAPSLPTAGTLGAVETTLAATRRPSSAMSRRRTSGHAALTANARAGRQPASQVRRPARRQPRRGDGRT